MPIALTELLEMILPWVARWFIAHAVFVVIKALAAAGFAIYVYTEFAQPLIDYARTQFNGIPGGIATWIHALALDKVASMLLAAYAISAATKVTLGRSAS